MKSSHKKVKKARQKPSKKAGFKAPRLWVRVGVAGVIGGALIVGTFLAADKLKTWVKDAQEKKSQLAALSEKEASHEQLKKDLNSLEKEAKVIQGALIKESQMIDLLEQIEALKQDLKINLSFLSFSDDVPRQDPEGHHYVEFTIEASGELAALKTFLEKILDWPYLIETRVVDISEMSAGTSQLIFKAWLYVDPNFFEEASQ